MEFDLTHTDALLSTTRAVRKRLDLDREVPDDVILECLQLAVQAPTGSNRQGWRWMVVKDAEKKAGLAELYRRAGRGLNGQLQALEDHLVGHLAIKIEAFADGAGR